MGRIHNIEGKKNKMDSLRSSAFTKHARNITVAARMGGGDPAYNASLKLAIDKAKADNMPNDNINRAIKKGIGANDGENYEHITYEGYGPSGVALIIECLTDNKNRTAGNVRHYLDKFGGNLGTAGCVSFMFERKGALAIDKEACPMGEDELMELVSKQALKTLLPKTPTTKSLPLRTTTPVFAKPSKQTTFHLFPVKLPCFLQTTPKYLKKTKKQ